MLPKLLLFVLGLYHVLRLVSEKEKETGIYMFFSQLHSQVLSSSLANALVARGKFYAQSTTKFCRIFDKTVSMPRGFHGIARSFKTIYKTGWPTIWCEWFCVCLFEYIWSNLNKVFLKNHCISQIILVPACISVTRVCHGLKYKVFCHR